MKKHSMWSYTVACNVNCKKVASATDLSFGFSLEEVAALRRRPERRTQKVKTLDMSPLFSQESHLVLTR
jgi:hypothetical protein